MIRRAREDDLSALLAIQLACPEAAQWSLDSLRRSLDHCLVAELDDAPAGFLLYLPVPPDEAEVLNVAVAPERRRRRVASGLLAALAAEIGGAIFLEVRASNGAARALYESVGFAVTAVRRSYYHDPVEDAYVMRRTSEIRDSLPMKY